MTDCTKKSQLDRFKETARKIGADESPDALDKVFGKLVMKRKPEDEKDAPKSK
jgi:hypothetical protein